MAEVWAFLNLMGAIGSGGEMTICALKNTRVSGVNEIRWVAAIGEIEKKK